MSKIYNYEHGSISPYSPQTVPSSSAIQHQRQVAVELDTLRQTVKAHTHLERAYAVLMEKRLFWLLEQVAEAHKEVEAWPEWKRLMMEYGGNK